jgi:mRNA-degrading endonuclease RelE of RelBE toxin-antitoxin system
MQSKQPTVQVKFTDEFKRRLRTLSKKYRSVRSDIQSTVAQLEIGDFVGDQIAGIGNTVFKVRIRNSDIQKGKSGGYRVIYQLESNTIVILLLIYSKSDQENVTTEEINSVIDEFQKEDNEE